MDVKQLIRDKIAELEIAFKKNQDVGDAIEENIKFLNNMLAQLDMTNPTYYNVFQDRDNLLHVSGGLKPLFPQSESELLLDKKMRGE